MVYFERSEFWHRTGYFSSQSWLPTPGLRVAGDRPTGGAHGWLKSAAGRAAGNELRTRKEHVSDRDAGFKQPLERCNLLTHWAFEYFDQTSIERYARRVEIDEIEANDCNLNISRYVSTAEEEVAAEHVNNFETLASCI